MKCQNCGYEHRNPIINYGKLFRDTVETRLIAYGFPAEMTPHKHQVATAVRTVIKIRYGIKLKTGGYMTEEEAAKAMTGLDEILPKKNIEFESKGVNR